MQQVKLREMLTSHTRALAPDLPDKLWTQFPANAPGEAVEDGWVSAAPRGRTSSTSWLRASARHTMAVVPIWGRRQWKEDSSLYILLLLSP